MEFDWKRTEARLYKREDVINDPDVAYASEEKKEEHWQRALKEYEAMKAYFIECPRFSYDEGCIRMQINKHKGKANDWSWHVYYSLDRKGRRLLDANGSISGSETSELLAKGAAEKAYLKALEVKTAVEALRRSFWAKWGGPEA